MMRFNLIDSSGPIRTTWWRTLKPLERGRLYRWMVTAEKDGEEIFAALQEERHLRSSGKQS